MKLSLALISLVLSSMPALSADVNPAVNILLEKAQSLEARGRGDLAAQVWQQVLVANPDQTTALAHLMRWTKSNGQPTQSAVYAARLRRLSPDAAELDEQESQSNTGSKARLDEASRLMQSGHFDEAFKIYRDVFGVKPPAGTWAVAYYEAQANSTGGYDAALAGLRNMAAVYPSNADYKLLLGRLMTYHPATRLEGVDLLSAIPASSLAGQKAKLAWRQALVWEKANSAFGPSVKLYLTRYADAELDADTSVMRNREIVRATPARPEDKDVQLGYAALKNGSLDSAENHFRDALKKNDSESRARAGLGFVAMKRRNFDTAVHEFEAAKDPATVNSALAEAKFWKVMREATIATDAQDWKSAVSLYQDALRQNPHSREASAGLGGSLLAANEPSQALPYLHQVVEANPKDEPGWCNLVKASLESRGPQSALRIIASIPDSVSARLADRTDWRVITASVHHRAGENDIALSLYRESLNAKTDDLSPDTLTALASLSLEMKQPSQAAVYAQRAVDAAPKTPAAWELLFSALIATGRMDQAHDALEHMPARVQSQAAAHPGFQQSLASYKEASGDLDGARTMLEALLKRGLPESARLDAQLQLADLDSKLGSYDSALALLNEVAVNRPDDVDLYRSRILLLNRMHQDAAVVDTFTNAPASVANRLRQQGDIVSVLAGCYKAENRSDAAVRLLDTYTIGGGNSNKTEQQLQLSWLLLDEPGSSAPLYHLLETLDRSPDLDAAGRKQLNNLWATWILRTAEASRKSGNTDRALLLLEQGAKTYRDNAPLQAAFAGNLLLAGQTRRAFNVYCNWNLKGGTADDYSGAIGAALSEHSYPYADAWLHDALNRWPNDARLLSLAGDLAQARGDVHRARTYWTQALAAKQNQPQREGELAQYASDERKQSLRALLVTDDSSATSPVAMVQGYAPVDGRSRDGALPVHLSAYDPAQVDVSQPAPFSLFHSPAHTAGLVRAIEPAEDHTLQDKLASLETPGPYFSSRTSVWGRGGEPGFDRLIIQQAAFEASTPLSDRLRASFILTPTYLSGGTATGSGTALFGSQTVPAGFGPQSASGIAAEAQLSSDWLGLRLGTTPRGFLVHNWIGGLRLSPFSQHVGIVLERDQVRDTMLSFAGVRDPVTNQTFGGVISNSAALQTHWGDANSGLYASGGYQLLEGTHVTRNNAVNGNLGVWWKVASLPDGRLTVGMNFSAMHYDQNLRYFTLGQGGYFSPQQYFLFNVPVRWTGAHGRFQYTLAGSLGLQHFTEDETGGGRYAALVSTGANFNFDGRLGYQLAPHWLMGGFATASNARDYTASSAGLFVKYTFEERPMNSLVASPAVPDWRGQQQLPF